jgi:CDP-paratose 2-epimerase
MAEVASGKKALTKYRDDNRKGDHIWYISDVGKFQSHYPDWTYKYSLNTIIEDIVRAAVDGR